MLYKMTMAMAAHSPTLEANERTRRGLSTDDTGRSVELEPFVSFGLHESARIGQGEAPRRTLRRFPPFSTSRKPSLSLRPHRTAIRNLLLKDSSCSNSLMWGQEHGEETARADD
jgi:hypothetical protein